MSTSKRSNNKSSFVLGEEDVKQINEKNASSKFVLGPDEVSQYQKEKFKDWKPEDQPVSHPLPTPKEEPVVAPGMSPDQLLKVGLTGQPKPKEAEPDFKGPVANKNPFSKAPGITPEKLFDNGVKGLGAVKEHDFKQDDNKTFLENDLTEAMFKDKKLAENVSSFFGGDNVKNSPTFQSQQTVSGQFPNPNKPVAENFDSLLGYAKRRIPQIETEIAELQKQDQKTADASNTILGAPAYAQSQVKAVDSPETASKKEYLARLKGTLVDAAVPLIIKKQYGDKPVTLDSNSLEQIGEKARRIKLDNTIDDDMGIINNPDAQKSAISRQTREVKKANNWAEGRDVIAKHYNNLLADKAKQVEPETMDKVLKIIQKPDYNEADQAEMKEYMKDPSVASFMNDLKKANDAQQSLDRSFKADYPQVARNNTRIAALNAMDRLNKSANKTLDKTGVGPNKIVRNAVQALLGVSPDKNDYPVIAKELGISEAEVKSIAEESYDMGMGIGAGTANGMRLRGFTQSIVSGIDQIVAGGLQGVNRIFKSKTAADLQNANIELRTEQYSEVPDSYRFTKKDGSLNLNLNSVVNVMGETTGQLAAFVVPNMAAGSLAASVEGFMMANAAKAAVGAASKVEYLTHFFSGMNKAIEFGLTTSTGTLSSYEQAYQEAAKYTTDQSKRHGYAMAISAVTGLSENILSPTQMVGKLQGGLTRPSFKTFERELKREGLTKTLLRTIAAGAKEGGMVVSDEVLEELMPIFVDPAAREAIIGKERTPGEAGNEFIQTVAQTAIGTALLGAGSSLTAMRDHARVQREGIFEAGIEHEKYVQYFKNQAATGQMTDADANEHIHATILALKSVAGLPEKNKLGKNFTHDQKVDLAATQFRYLWNEYKKEKATFVAEKAQYEQNAKDAQADQEKVLNGESLDPTPQSQQQINSIANKVESTAEGKPKPLSPSELKKIEENPDEIQAAGIDIFNSVFGELSNKVEPESAPEPSVVHQGEEWQIKKDLGDGRLVITKTNGSEITVNANEVLFLNIKKDPKEPPLPPAPASAMVEEKPKVTAPETKVVEVTPAPNANNSKEESVKEQVDAQVEALQQKIDAEPDEKKKEELQAIMDEANQNYALLMGELSGMVGVDTQEVVKQMKPITDEMANIERELKNGGLAIDLDYDNEISVTNIKTDELVEPDEIPKALLPLVQKYEKAAKQLTEFDEKAAAIALAESRKLEDAPAEVVETVKPAIPEKVEPKAEPKPKTEPKAEEKPKPKAEPKPEPKAETPKKEEPKPIKSGPPEVDVIIDKQGTKLKGRPINITGFPMDAVITQQGLQTQIRELSSGQILGEGMGKEDALADMKDQLKGRDVNKLKEKLYGQYDLGIPNYTNSGQKQLNSSPAFDRWLADRKFKEEKAPFLYTEEERARMQAIIDGYSALEQNDDTKSVIRVYQSQIDRKKITGKETKMTSFTYAEEKLKSMQDGTYQEPPKVDFNVAAVTAEDSKRISVAEKRKRAITKTKNLYNKKIAELKKNEPDDLFLNDRIAQLEAEMQDRIAELNARYDKLELENPSKPKEEAKPVIIDQLYNELLDIDKPVISLDFVPNEDIKTKSNTAESDIKKQEELTKQFEVLNEILSCLWS